MNPLEEDLELLGSREYLFWRNVAIPPNPDTECWLWNRSTTAAGYGQIVLKKDENGKAIRIYAHRFSYLIHVGPIPDDLLCLHTCDNRRCCNPDHLFLGTRADNAKDMFAKGRDKESNGYKWSDETRQKQSVVQTGKTHTEETKRKMSEAQLKRYRGA